MPITFSLRRRIRFQEKDIDRIEFHTDDYGVSFAKLFLKPSPLVISVRTGNAIAKAFPSKVTTKIGVFSNEIPQ
jgi:hypothetical protein